MDPIYCIIANIEYLDHANNQKLFDEILLITIMMNVGINSDHQILRIPKYLKYVNQQQQQQQHIDSLKE